MSEIPNATSRLKLGTNWGLVRRVANLKVQGVDKWDAELINSLVIEEDAQAIMAISWPPVVCEDKLIWKGNLEGKFSIKSCYWLNFANEG